MPLLSVRGLTTEFATARGRVVAAAEVSFDLEAGETLGIVGESGSGKSVTALSLLRLIRPPGRITGGQILFEGRDLLAMPLPALRHIRGNGIAMVFQEPMSALNPLMTIGAQIAEPLRLHQGLGAAAARRRAIELLDRVGIADPARRVDDHPHSLSGGMRQRAVIAMALACSPKVLIADEPTTALDVTIQAQILDLLGDLRRELGMAIILITHDLAVVADFADRVLVMYAGRVVEASPARGLFDRPVHPYTAGLLSSAPGLDEDVERLTAIDGVVPSPLEPPPGCAFAPRCRHAVDACDAGLPAFVAVDAERRAACVRAGTPGFAP